MFRRVASVIGISIATMAVVLGVASPASAAPPTQAEKLRVISVFTQPTATSYLNWGNARLNQRDWAIYNLDWSHDFCSSSPDQPLGFDFRWACARHDFGYRNYNAHGQLGPNRLRVDNALHADLIRKCDSYSRIYQPACDFLAGAYYRAVRTFGGLYVSQRELDQAEDLLP